MKKISLFLFVTLFIIAFSINSFALYNTMTWYPTQLPFSSNGNIAAVDYSTGTYYAYSTMCQYVVSNAGAYPYPIAAPGALNSYYATTIYEFPQHMFRYQATVPSNARYQITIGRNNANSGYQVPVCFPDGNAYTGNDFTIGDNTVVLGVNQGKALLQFMPTTKRTFSALFSGTTSGEIVNNVIGINGFSVYCPDATDLQAQFIGVLEYLDSNGDYHKMVVDDIIDIPTVNSVIPDPFTIAGTSFTKYYFNGHILITSSTVTRFQSTVAYEYDKQHYIDIFEGRMDTQDDITLEYIADPKSRIYSEILVSANDSDDPLFPPLNLTISENGTYPVNGTYNGGSIVVNVPTSTIPPDVPEGDIININANGNYDVSEYDYARVNVPQENYETPSMFGWLIDSVQSFLNIEFADGVTPGVIILFIAGLALLIWILKIFLGG